MKRPRIGITMDSLGTADPAYKLQANYATAIEKAGGIPFPLPFHTDLSLIPQIVDALDGVLFTGGNDIDPTRFGQERHPKAEPLDPARERFELALLAEVDRRQKPALCICLGCQMLNVHRGGSLTQFLPGVDRANPIEHRKLPEQKEPARHAVHLEADSIIAKVLSKTEVLANTYHKQAVQRVGKGLRIIAYAPDGTPEAVEDPSRALLLGVQWHPERLHDEADHLALFKLLVERALEQGK